jgi:DNA-binding transcriptional MocR family regulator
MAAPVQTLRISGKTGREIADSIEAAVQAGALAPGQVLPSVRTLADQLGVSRVTVSGAFRQLKSRGVVTAQERHRTRISPRPAISRPMSIPLSGDVIDLASDNPDPAFLPDLRGAAERVELAPHLYGGETVFPPLAAFAGQEFQRLGVDVGQVCVFSGTFDVVERILAAHLKPGDRVAVEDPGYTGVLDLVRALGLIPVGCVIDESGVLAEELERALSGGALAFVVTPRAQNPSGAAMTESRARELRAVLSRFPSTVLIEDDHAGPVTSDAYYTLTAGMEHWAVIRSVSKFLGPDLRLALVTADNVTTGRIEGRQLLASGWVSFVLQRLVIALWSDGATRRLLKRAAKAYDERRQALIDALSEHGITAWGRSGLNIWIPVQEETPAVRNLLQLGIAVAAGEIFRLGSPPAVRVTTAGLPTSQAQELAGQIALALHPPGRRTSRS